MPEILKKRFYTVSGKAIANKKYRWGLSQLERYANMYALSDNQLYILGLLYDHLAMKTIGTIDQQIKKIPFEKKRILKKCLAKAKTFYKKIINQNPKHIHALYGIGRIYSIKGNVRTALTYQKKAYREMMKHPQKLRGGFAIGGHYETLGDLKNAERWFLKEYRECRKSDINTTINLFSFYRRQRRYRDALRYVKKLEKLLHTEFQKKQYRGLGMKSSSFVKQIKWEIDEVKKMALRVAS